MTARRRAKKSTTQKGTRKPEAPGGSSAVERPPRRPPHRLPTSVQALSIELSFEFDPRQKHFKGEAHYELQLAKRQRQIVLHAAELKVSTAYATVSGVRWRARVEVVAANETIVLRFDDLLPKGEVDVDLRFRGRVRDDLRGLYRSSDPETPWLATQLCPTDARRVFPCLDEPGSKARYRIRVTAPIGETVLSNAPVESEEPLGDGRKTVQFEETPPLSAYLVAVAVGPFVASPPAVVGSTTIRVYALPGRDALMSFAREAATESLARLEAWFGMPHPYPKLDLLALPDFAFGAMENAGAVFFRDSILLIDPEQASSEELKRTGEVVAHELSHMWFGNLVTMAWWNDLWLNESFATWMAYEIIDDWRPDWHIWLDFAQRRESALEVDALASSHPIAPRIRTAEEAQENFDAITYTKGASVMRMLARYVGAKVFQEGIRLYIRRHAESAATAQDLWVALAEASGGPVDRIVAPWTTQTGYPIVSLRLRSTRDGAQLELDQARFLLRAPARPPRKPARWTVPWVGRSLLPGSKGDASWKHLLTKSRERLTRTNGFEPPLYGNADEGGFFRVQHDPALFEAIVEGGGLARMNALERVGFLGHQWALTLAGREEVRGLFELIRALAGETDPDVLFQVERILARLTQRLAAAGDPHLTGQLRAWIEDVFGAQLDLLGLDGLGDEAPRRALRRARIVALVGGLARRQNVVLACEERALRHLEAGERLPAELAESILEIAAARGDASLHAALIESLRASQTPQGRRRALFALGAFEDPALVRASLRATLDAGLAPIPDRAGLLIAMLSRSSSAPLAWAQLQRSWARLEKQMPPILLARIASATSIALPASRAPEIRAFLTDHPLAAGTRTLRQIREELAIAGHFERNVVAAAEAYLAD